MKSRELLRAFLVREIEAIKESDDLNPVSEEELNLELGVIPKSDLKPYPDDLSPKPGDPDQDERTLVLRENLAVLREAVDGLDSLDWGEIPDIFAPTKGQWGKHPAAAKRLTAKAARYVGLVHETGLNPKRARELVAKEFGEEPGTIRQWIREVEESKDPRLQDSITTCRQLYKVKIKRVFPLSDLKNNSFFLSEIKTDGIAFRKARTSKRAGKEGT
jgi:hypothetical protein